MKRIITSTDAPAAIGPYSQAVDVNGTLYISGQLPIDPSTGSIVEGGIKEQTKQSLENIKAILGDAGGTMENIVKTTCLLKNIGDFAAMNMVYSEYFKTDYPARAAFQVATLPKDSLIEIEAVAVIG